MHFLLDVIIKAKPPFMVHAVVLGRAIGVMFCLNLQLGYTCMWKVASIVKFWMRYWRKGGQYDLSSEAFHQYIYTK